MARGQPGSVSVAVDVAGQNLHRGVVSNVLGGNLRVSNIRRIGPVDGTGPQTLRTNLAAGLGSQGVLASDAAASFHGKVHTLPHAINVGFFAPGTNLVSAPGRAGLGPVTLVVQIQTVVGIDFAGGLAVKERAPKNLLASHSGAGRNRVLGAFAHAEFVFVDSKVVVNGGNRGLHDLYGKHDELAVLETAIQVI